MPKVGKKHFPYTKKGYKAAAKARKKKGKKKGKTMMSEKKMKSMQKKHFSRVMGEMGY